MNATTRMFPDKNVLDELQDPHFMRRHPRLYAKLMDLNARGYFGRKLKADLKAEETPETHGKPPVSPKMAAVGR